MLRVARARPERDQTGACEPNAGNQLEHAAPVQEPWEVVVEATIMVLEITSRWFTRIVINSFLIGIRLAEGALRLRLEPRSARPDQIGPFIRQAQMLTTHTQCSSDSRSRIEPAGVTSIDVREGTFRGGLPYLAVGSGEPLLYLCGSTLTDTRDRDWSDPRAANGEPAGPCRLRGLLHQPLAWDAPGHHLWEVAERHAEGFDYFGQPVDVLGHSTGGSLALQLIADRPDVVRKAVVASAAPCSAQWPSATSSNCCMRSGRPVATPPRPSWTAGRLHPFPPGSHLAHTARDGGCQAHHRREPD